MRWLFLCAALLAAACGARTGLDVPPANHPLLLFWSDRFDSSGGSMRPDVGLVALTSEREGFVAQRFGRDLPPGWIDVSNFLAFRTGPRLSPDARLAGMSMTTDLHVAGSGGLSEDLALVFDATTGRTVLGLSSTELHLRYLRSDFPPCRAMIEAAARVAFASEGRVVPRGAVVHAVEGRADDEATGLRFLGFAPEGRPVFLVLPLVIEYEARSPAGAVLARSSWNGLNFYLAFTRRSDGGFGAPDYCDTRRPLLQSDPPQVYRLTSAISSGVRRVFVNGTELRRLRSDRPLLLLDGTEGETSGIHGGWRAR